MMTITTIAVTAITPLTHINHFHSDELIVTHHIITTAITVNNGNVNVIMLIRVIMNIIKKMIIKELLKNLLNC